jgi:hypothetical protein
MISMRGQASDYDHWRQLGLTGGAGTMFVQCSSALMTIFWANLNITVSVVSGGWNAQV